jgi:hypothetical protein
VKEKVVYQGNFKEGKFHGFGMYDGLDGESYNGIWNENHKDGLGYYVKPNGNIYKGY